MNERLEALGWGPSQQAALREHAALHPEVEATPLLDMIPARVVRQERGWVGVDTGEQLLRAAPSGRLKHAAAGAADLPIIGDWVLIPKASLDSGGVAQISDILKRTTILLRRRAGGVDAQPLAANVDIALAVVGLDRELSLELLERALVMAQAGGVEAAVVLSKLDACAAWSEQTERVRERLTGVRVVPISVHSGQGMDAVRALIGPRRTATMMGPSGVGKSSLVNHLLGSTAMQTGAVRTDDHKGKHTTTHRQLFVLPEGGVLIDGPGMREMGVWGDATSVLDSFPDVLASASRCAHADCEHNVTSGCAVQDDIESGKLSAARFEDYQKLRQEIGQSEQSSRRRRSQQAGSKARFRGRK